MSRRHHHHLAWESQPLVTPSVRPRRYSQRMLLLVAIVASGESSGRLAPALGRASNELQRELDALVSTLVALVEPLVNAVVFFFHERAWESRDRPALLDVLVHRHGTEERSLPG